MYQLFGKRLLDVVLVVAALPLLAPLALIVTLAVRISAGSPVLFRQARTGLEGATFEMIKFRTMTSQHGDSGELLPDAERITNVGRFLRATSLDEIPEFLHVLRGDMSLVGPRPLLPQYLELYSAEQRRRHGVRPGVTGLAQTEGRNSLTWERQFELDVDYVDTVSLALDSRLLVRTLKEIVSRDGARNGSTDPKPVFGGSATAGKASCNQAHS